MLMKQKGYDEFLADKVAKGLQDYKQGRFHTAEQAKQRIEQTLIRKERELQEQMNNASYA
ncbi:hypothetical protein ACWIVU_07230 [Ursidibacter arcticus]